MLSKKIIEKAPLFNLTIIVNGETYKKRTTDVKKAILDVRPDFSFVDSYITMSTGSGKSKVTTERKLNLTQTKKLFNDELFLDVFINNLLTEYA